MSKEILVATKDVVVGTVEDHKKQTKADGSAVKVIACKIDDKAYADSIKNAGLDMKTVNAIKEHDASYIENITRDAVAAGAQILSDNKEADKVVFVGPYAGDKVSAYTSKIIVDVNREVKVNNIATKEVSYRPDFKVEVVNKFQKTGDALKNDMRTLLQEKLANS